MPRLLVLIIVILVLFFVKKISTESPKAPPRQSAHFEESYMLFGINVNSQNTIKGFIAGIPLHIARPMLKKNPDMLNCGSPISAQAKNEVATLTIIELSSNASQKMNLAQQIFEKSLKDPNVPRPYVRIQGQTFDSKQPYNGIIFHMTDSDRLISLQDIAIVPC